MPIKDLQNQFMHLLTWIQNATFLEENQMSTEEIIGEEKRRKESFWLPASIIPTF